MSLACGGEAKSTCIGVDGHSVGVVTADEVGEEHEELSRLGVDGDDVMAGDKAGDGEERSSLRRCSCSSSLSRFICFHLRAKLTQSMGRVRMRSTVI